MRKLTPQAGGSLQSEVDVLSKLVDDLHQFLLSDEGALAYRKEATNLVQLLEITTGSFNDAIAATG